MLTVHIAPGGREDRVLLIFAKAPRPGRVKTRLIPSLGAEGACRLHQALLADTLDLAARLSDVCRCRVVLAWAGEPGDDPPLRCRLPPFTVVQQNGADLGERLAAAHQHLFAAGATAVVTLGSDSPTLPAAFVEEAFSHLPQFDVVLGPATDGGFVLLGAARFAPLLFRYVPWGTSSVAETTCAQAAAAGLSLHRLADWYDVDDAAALARLQRELQNAAADCCPDTRRVLADMTC